MSGLIDALVVGAGQAGLAAAWALQEVGLEPVVLEAGERPTGSWPRYYESLTLFSPARYSGLPGMAFPGYDPDRYPKREEVTAYLILYAAHLGVAIRVLHRVVEVGPSRWGFRVRTEGGEVLEARSVVAASGGFGLPHRPRLRESCHASGSNFVFACGRLDRRGVVSGRTAYS